MRPQRNKLAPQDTKGRIQNFLLNFVWAAAWLVRWAVRLGRRLFRGKDDR